MPLWGLIMNILSRRFFYLFAACLLILYLTPAQAQTPRYQDYFAPFPVIGGDAAEPSIGVNWKTGKVMYQSGLESIQLSFDDSTSPARVTWKHTPSLLTSLFSLDPVLFTDAKNGRTFVSQLDGGCSLTEFTDNDGQTWIL
ncbi:MAG TPA: hypothetical protein VI958_06795, partial [Acidobacteriota bacterium]